MTSAKITTDAEYLTITLQRIRSVGLNADLYARIREEVESDPRFKDATTHVREEIEAALEARRFNIAKLSGVL